METEQERLTAAQLAAVAEEIGISLGKNPERTIGYYKQMGLLKPQVIQDGSVRRAFYSRDDLTILKTIDTKKKRGLTLEQIKEVLRSPIFLSEAGQEFIKQFKDEYPETAFVPGSPVTWGEMAFFLVKLQNQEPFLMMQIFLSAFVGLDKEPVGPDELEIAMLRRKKP